VENTHGESVARLLRAAASAHAEYETTVLGGVRDEDWAGWYATYLLDHGLKDVLPTSGLHAVNRLAARLKQLDADYRREQPGEEWPEFYARHMVAAS
jgi:cobalamin biosynthesis Mg chelatase CobN